MIDDILMSAGLTGLLKFLCIQISIRSQTGYSSNARASPS